MALLEADCLNRLKFASANIDEFYKEDLLIYQGRTKDSKKLYNEIAAAYIYDHIELFKKIKKMTRQESYCTDVYKRYDHNQSNLNTQKILTLNLYRQRQMDVGMIIDCQTPIGDHSQMSKMRKVDALMHTERAELFILVVKLPTSEQSLLRYIVECLTLYRQLDHTKLLADFGLSANTRIKVAPVLFKDSKPYRELSEARYWLYHLMAILELNLFVIEDEKYPYQMTRHHFEVFANHHILKALSRKQII